MIKCLHGIVFSLVLYWLIPTAYAMEFERVSVSSAGEQSNDYSYGSSISADGRFVAFSSLASNLVAGDTNDLYDIFVHDRTTGITESLSSTGLKGYPDSFVPSISANGRFVAFSSSESNLVVGDTNDSYDIFVHDRSTGITERVSVSSTGEQGNNSSSFTSISADGRFVAFQSQANNLVAADTNNRHDIFVHDRSMRTTERVNVSSAGQQTRYNASFAPSISADGRFVAFSSDAFNLVEGDTNGEGDVFVHDRDTGITELVSVSSTGKQGLHFESGWPSISADGRFVAFRSRAENLVENYTYYKYDIYVHDRTMGITERVSVSSIGEQGDDFSYAPSISADGRFVAFASGARNLVVDDTSRARDIFVHDRTTSFTQRVNVSPGGVQDNGYSYAPSISADGRFMAFQSKSRNLVEGDTNGQSDVFVSGNNLFDLTDDLMVSLLTTSGTTQVGEYIRFRARLKNNGNTTLTNCKALLVNPLVNGRREFSYSTLPIQSSQSSEKWQY